VFIILLKNLFPYLIHSKEIPINLKLVEKIEDLYCTVGVHPHSAKDVHHLTDLNILEKYVSNPKVIAIGECGLDYDRMFSPKEKQMDVFRKQIQIAKKYNKPLYLHCRGKTDKEDSFEDMVQILNEEQYFHGIVHCFTGTIDQASTFIKLGFYLGITGWIYDERRNHDLYKAIQKVIPIDKIMVETDAPWLSIDKKRKSMPLDTAFIADKISKIKKVPFHEATKIFYQNTLNLFKF
jgi:TatD DNase family protein